MMNITSEAESWEPIQFDLAPSPAPSPEKMTLEEIRQTSNVIQALENVITQMEDDDTFDDIRDGIEAALGFSQRRLFRLIHRSSL